MKILEIAKNEIGYLEKKSNYMLYEKTANAGSNNFTKYWAELEPSYQGQPWCLAFCCWCLDKVYGRETALNLLNCKDYTYYTPTQAQYFKNANQWSDTPALGSLIFFKNSSRIHHVGIVADISDNYVTTIEGNTSDATTEVVANGGAVCQKKYVINNPRIAGYGIINYPVEKIKCWELKDGYWYRYGNNGEILTGYHKIYDKEGNLRECFFGDDGKLYHEADDKQGYLEPWKV